jgi:hypothetical protein
MRRERPRKKRKRPFMLLHAKKRAFQRYGLILEDGDLQKIENKIRKGNAELQYKQSNAISVWKVDYRGREIVAVYNKKQKALSTLLTRKQLEINLNALDKHTPECEELNGTKNKNLG